MKVHTIKLAIRLFFLTTSSAILAQNDFQGKAYYQTKTTIDLSNFGGRELSEERKKEIAERMKSSLEKTFILTFNQLESLYKEEARLETPGQGSGMRFSMMNINGGEQYKNVKTQQILKEQEFMGKQFLINDSLQKLDWKLGTETKIIGQYTCFKATAIKKAEGFDFSSFRRRPNNEKVKDSTNNTNKEAEDLPKEVLVTAWYTPQIPINQGPDMYWGLPGLILEVNADRTTILCTKIILNPKEKKVIEVPSKGKDISQQAYDLVVKEKMEEMRQMYRGSRFHRGRR